MGQSVVSRIQIIFCIRPQPEELSTMMTMRELRHSRKTNKEKEKEIKTLPPPRFSCVLGKEVDISKVTKIEGRDCRDGGVGYPKPPLVGHTYECIGILTTQTGKIVCQNHETRQMERLMELSKSVSVLYPTTATAVYMLVRKKEPYPIFVNDQLEVVHYLVDGWTSEMYCCFEIDVITN